MTTFDKLTLALALSASLLGGCGNSGGSGVIGAAGETNEPSDSGNNGGRSSSGAKGNFDSVWHASNGTVAVVPVNGAFPKEVDVDLPDKIMHPDYETDVEIFEQLQGETLVVFAHFDGSEVYHRLRFPLTSFGTSSLTWITTSGASAVYSLESGRLKRTMTQQTETEIMLSTTYYDAYSGDFPPEDWPSKVLDVEPSNKAGAP